MVTAVGAASSFGLVCASGAVLLAVLCVAPRAHAQSAEVQAMAPGRGMVLAHVSAGEHSFEISFGRGKRPVADCWKECDFWAWPGKYRVLVRQGEGPEDDASVALNVRRSGRYAFVPAHGAAQNAGLILGVTGPVIGFVGAVLTAAGLFQTCSDPAPGESCDGKPTAFYVGLGVLAAGAGMTAAGWPLYLHNRAHFDESDSAPRPSAHLAVVPLPHGGLGLGTSFAF